MKKLKLTIIMACLVTIGYSQAYLNWEAGYSTYGKSVGGISVGYSGVLTIDAGFQKLISSSVEAPWIPNISIGSTVNLNDFKITVLPIGVGYHYFSNDIRSRNHVQYYGSLEASKRINDWLSWYEKTAVSERFVIFTIGFKTFLNK